MKTHKKKPHKFQYNNNNNVIKKNKNNFKVHWSTVLLTPCKYGLNGVRVVVAVAGWFKNIFCLSGINGKEEKQEKKKNNSIC